MPFIYGPSGGVDILTVPGGYAVMEDTGITEAITDTGPMATVVYKVYDANQRYSFVNQLLGRWTGTPPSSIVYVGPFRYPPSPNLLCTQVTEIKSLGRKVPMLNVGLPYWFGQHAVVTAVFTRPPWQAADGGGYFSISFSGSGEFKSIPKTTMLFSDGTPTLTSIGRLVPQAQITVTRYRMPFLPDSIAMSLMGQLNNAPFQIGWNIYPTGTLLFTGMTSETQADSLGNITFQVGYMFNYRPLDWNYFIHPGRPFRWEIVTDTAGGGGNTVYNYANFDTLP